MPTHTITAPDKSNKNKILAIVFVEDWEWASSSLKQNGMALLKTDAGSGVGIRDYEASEHTERNQKLPNTTDRWDLLTSIAESELPLKKTE